MNIAIYTSAHGYGHSTRSFEVAQTLIRKNPDARVFFMSWASVEVFAAGRHPRIIHRRVKLDVGLRQVDSLTIDLPGTLNDLKQWEAEVEGLINQEVAFLQQEGIKLILSDLPPLAFEIARRTGIRAFGIANFSWDWIYHRYVQKFPEFRPYIRRFRQAYQGAEILFRLPFSGPMRAFRHIVDVPLIARTSSLGRKQARERLGLEQGEPVALFSFGGFGLDLQKVPAGEGMILLTTDPSPDPGKPFRHLHDRYLLEMNLTYPDLVAAADVVISKPGYGIVSECLANRAALLYTPRGDFREYPILVREMKRSLLCRRILPEDLLTGRWVKAFEALRREDFPAPTNCNGAKIIAEWVFSEINS